MSKKEEHMYNEEEITLAEMVQDLAPIYNKYHGEIGTYKITPKGVYAVHQHSGDELGPFTGPKRIAAEEAAKALDVHHEKWLKKVKKEHEEQQVELYSKMISEHVKREGFSKKR